MTKVFLAISLVALSLCSTALGKTQIVAVIDTGVDQAAGIKLCPTGSIDFVTHSTSPTDNLGHGTHIASTIQNNAGKADFCIVSIRYYSDSAPGSLNLANMIKAIEHAVSIHADYINISGGGPSPNKEEKAAIKKALDNGIKVVVAAGNDHHDISIEDYRYYPADYDKRIVVVGNLVSLGHRSPSSNYGGPTNRWEIGTNVRSNIPCFNSNSKPPCSGLMSGTSQATAVATGKLISQAFLK